MLFPKKTRFLNSLTPAIAGLLISISCVSVNPNPPSHQIQPSPTPINPVTILHKSGQEMTLLDSFQFELTHRNGRGSPANGFLLSEATGLIEKPEKIRVIATMLLGNLVIEGELITTNQGSFIRNPLTNRWANIEPEVSPLNFFDPEEGIMQIMDNVINPSLQSQDEYHFIIDGALPADTLSPIVGTTTTNNVEVSIWINRESLLMTKAEILGVLHPQDDIGMVRIMKISRFNESLDITLPNME